MLEDTSRKLIGAHQISVLFNLRELGASIELFFEDELKAPPEGIYSSSQVEPVIVAGRKYFFVVKGESFPLEHVKDAKGAIFDESGHRIISASQVRNQAVTLSNTPFLPYRGIKIAKLLYEHQIDTMIAWRRHSSNRLSLIAQQFEPEIDTDKVEEYLHDFQLEVSANLHPIIRDHEWHYFHTKQVGSDLQVERGEDYRVAYFMERYDKGEIKL